MTQSCENRLHGNFIVKDLEKSGIDDFEFIRVTDSDFTKGKTQINDQEIDAIAAQGRNLLREECHVS